MHGHNYRVVARFAGRELDGMGMVADFGELKLLLDEVVGLLDHRNLNESPALQGGPPTAERIAQHISRAVSALLAEREPLRSAGLRVASVTVWESARSSVTYEDSE